MKVGDKVRFGNVERVYLGSIYEDGDIVKEEDTATTVTNPMTTEEYFEFIDKLCEEMKALVRAKNADYTGGESPFANFTESEKFGVNPIVGLSVRMGDKMKRLQSYCKKGKLEVSGEGVDDIFKDFIGYSWLGLGMLEELRRK